MIVDLFAGPGGWSEGLHALGLTDTGLEWDTAACRTRAAAGHPTIQCDVAQYPTSPFFGRTTGLIASPPCQAWSRAGKRAGLADQPLVHQAVADLAHGRDTRTALHAQCADPRSLLAAEPMRWLHDLRPEWVAMEEVPDVLPLWRQYAQVLRGWGYSVWAGVLNAADYGVPQTRRRAMLLASRVRAVTAPEPTHTEHPGGEGLFGGSLPGWVSMAEALGWGATDRVSPTVTAGGGKTGGAEPFPSQARQARQALLDAQGRGAWVLGRPATTVCATNRIAPPGHRDRSAGGESQFASPDTVRITVREAAVLQSFRRDYPWQGTRTKQFEQVGNAVPPRLAAVVVAVAAGVRLPVPAAVAA
ncbi:DNA cytosine methyltransferase [Streptomyces sp. C10-9-1]|uniref:DNA cytosine methyltransferase n=1 Tax=Streptomyces sp. C10-9-1 TaxID=1859285 RepID=UPI003D74709B